MIFRSMLVAVAALCLALPAQAVEQRSLNNGNLILEDIPPIPEDIVSDLNRYQNARSASFQGWSQDGNSLYITTRFGDVSQIHRVDKAGGSRHQLTFFDEPIGSVVMRPKHNQLAFTMDSGGNEFAQIFLLDLTSGEHWMISGGESRNDALVWDESGTRLAFQSTRRNGRSNDIWMAEFSNDDRQPEQTLVHAANEGSWWGPVAFSANGDLLLMQQYTSSTQSAVHLKNLKTGKTQRLAGDDKHPSRNYGAGFDANYNGVYLLTDRFSEFTQLTHMNLSDGKESVITEDIR